jgi:hypothetical protein
MEFEITGGAAMVDYTGRKITLCVGGQGREEVVLVMTPEVARAIIAEMTVELDACSAPVETLGVAPSEPEIVRAELPEGVRAELFGAIADGTAVVSDIRRVNSGFVFTARVGNWRAHGALVNRTTVAIVALEEVDETAGIAFEPFGPLVRAEATTDEKVAILARWSPTLHPRWAEFGIIGRGRAVHVRERGKSSTLCNRPTGVMWLDRSEWARDRCTRCNAAMDARDNTQR